jgi:hypothetical protein
MPNISNLALNLQHSNVTDPNSNRTATVTFTLNFNSVEILAGVVFKADINLRSLDQFDFQEASFALGPLYIKASGAPVSQTVTKILKRRNLDEDADFRVVNGNVIATEVKDHWEAIVTLSPVTFQTVTAHSPEVIGSWGLLGAD